MSEYELNINLLSLTVSDIFSEMGYGKIKPEEPVRILTISIFNYILTWIKPRCSFSILNGRIEENTICLEKNETLETGTVITSLLKGSTRFALFTATVGEAFQQYQEELSREGDLLKIFIADIIGTCIVEKTGDYMEYLLKQELRGARHTNRLSPGYCGWHLTGQKQLFRLQGENPCGIYLSDVCLMKPIKSISGIIGIGNDVDEKKYGCQYCELETCYKRKK